MVPTVMDQEKLYTIYEHNPQARFDALAISLGRQGLWDSHVPEGNELAYVKDELRIVQRHLWKNHRQA